MNKKHKTSSFLYEIRRIDMENQALYSYLEKNKIVLAKMMLYIYQICSRGYWCKKNIENEL